MASKRWFAFTFSLFIAMATVYAKPSDVDFASCTKDADCSLVISNFCFTVEAINKNNLSGWRKSDVEKSAASKDHTCSPMPRQQVISDYKAQCVSNKCTSSRIKPW